MSSARSAAVIISFFVGVMEAGSSSGTNSTEIWGAPSMGIPTKLVVRSDDLYTSVIRGAFASSA